MRKFIHSYDNIITIDNLLLAWQEFLRGKKKKKDVVLFEARLSENIFLLRNDLLARIYRHGGYYEFYISDPKPRIIHKASVRDRLLHHLLYQELYYYFDKKFIYDSYSCRKNKGSHRALKQFSSFGRIMSKNNTQTCWVLKCDIKKFFASIDHFILKGILNKYIEDKDILILLENIIDSFYTKDRHYTGLPLGNLTSQLLVNIYMNEFDQFMKRDLKEKYYIRYADDFVVLSEDKQHLETALEKISDFLANNLKLSLHPDKVFIKTLASGVDFLGWVHFSHHRALRTATKRRMIKNLISNPKEGSHTSYKGMLSHGNAYTLEKEINNFLY